MTYPRCLVAVGHFGKVAEHEPPSLEGKHIVRTRARFALVLACSLSHAVYSRASSAAFSRQGDLAEVTVGESFTRSLKPVNTPQLLHLEVIRANGTRQSGQATVRTDKYGGAELSVFFSADGKLVAVVTQVPLQDPASVHVWDVTSARWLSSFDLAPRPGLEGRIAVLGFWRGGRGLVVQSWRMVDLWHSAEGLALVSPLGETLAGPRAGHYPQLDVERGRVWTASGGWGGCGATMAGTKYLQCKC